MFRARTSAQERLGDRARDRSASHLLTAGSATLCRLPLLIVASSDSVNTALLNVAVSLVLGASSLFCSSCDASPHHAAGSASVGSVSVRPQPACPIDSARAVARADSALRVPGETEPLAVTSFKREEKRYVLQLSPNLPNHSPVVW